MSDELGNDDNIVVIYSGVQATRTLPTLAVLNGLVMQALHELTANKASFTAFSVTLRLRQSHPMYEIEHLRTESTQGVKTVQEIVHELMEIFCDDISTNNYVSEWHNWGRDGMDDPNGSPAMTYIHIDNLSPVVSLPTVPVTDDPNIGTQPALPVGNVISWDED